MKRLIVIIILIIDVGITKGQQNIVPNPSFEEFYSCEGNLYIESAANFWYGTSNYFISCRDSVYFGNPYSQFGFQESRSGQAHCGLYTYGKSLDSSTFRNYIQVKLINSLLTAKSYKVEFYVASSEALHAKSNSIGAYFSADSFFVSNIFLGLIDVVPQVQNNHNNDLSDTANWTLVSGSFIANGTERYLTIGNFLPDSLSNIIPLDSVCSQPKGYGCAVFLYIDDVSVVLDDDSGIEESLLANNIKIFPNPSKDLLRIEMQTNFNGTIKINNALGKEVYNANFQNNISNFTIDTKDFESGLYFISFRNERGELNKKFIKQ
jgi:hypothetical protein